MDFNINFRDIIYQLMPYWLRVQGTLLYLYAAIKGLKDVNISFLDFYDAKRRILKHNAQTMNIEHYLNLEYDPVNEGIYIENISENAVVYRYNVAEWQPPLYHYNLYDNSTAYIVGEYVSYGNDIYVCIQNTTWNYPSDDSYWTLDVQQIFYYNSGETASLYNFIIWIPDSIKVICGYPNYTTFTAKVNQFVFSDKYYIIQTY